ncbi:MAG: hypothetical protein C0473_01215 [Cyanobacteria bacterium DS3.002]|nr:hypothetical protein [Cyanobacteria bacterium DS3.002]
MFGISQAIIEKLSLRERPTNNEHWANSDSYLSNSLRFWFIGCLLDISIRTGFACADVLSDEHLRILERILHFAAQEESKKISWASSIELSRQAISITREDCDTVLFLDYVTDRCLNVSNISLSQKYPFMPTLCSLNGLAIRRGDSILFAAPYLASNYDEIYSLVQGWHAILTTVLLIDDLNDIEEDIENNELNTFLELKLSKSTVLHVAQVLKQNDQIIGTKNPEMARELEKLWMPKIINLLLK